MSTDSTVPVKHATSLADTIYAHETVGSEFKIVLILQFLSAFYHSVNVRLKAGSRYDDSPS